MRRRDVTRRSGAIILFALVAVALGGVFALGGPHASGALPTKPPSSKPERLMLIYVGADDCAPCRTWRRDGAAALLAKPGFARLVYREVKSPSVRDVLKDEYWPDDLRGFRAQLGPGAGVPLWLVVADDTVVGHGYGMSEWRTTIAPKLESLLR